MAAQVPQFLSVEIPSAETSLADRRTRVTLYNVCITAIGRREVWAVFRRYSKFFDLRVQLQKRFPNQTLPPIPPKRLLGKEDPLFIEQRRNELGEFLNALLREPAEISLSEELCLFLEVPEPLRLCLLDSLASVGDPARFAYLHPMDGSRALATGSARCQNSLSMALMQLGGPGGQSSQQDVCRVRLLMAHLQEHPNNKVALLRTFEGWVLRAKPPLTEGDVQLLYLGFDLQGGLLEEVGAFEHSEVSAIAALSLLNRLLSHEYCSEAPLFRRVLQRLDPSVLARMRLSHHILRDRGQSNRLDAFQVLQSLESELCQEKLMALLQDELTLQEFQRWQESVQSWLSLRTLHQSSLTSRRRTSGNIEPSSLLPGRKLSTREYRRIADNAFTSVQMCLTTFNIPEGESSGSADAAACYSQEGLTGEGSTAGSVLVENSGEQHPGGQESILSAGPDDPLGAAVTGSDGRKGPQGSSGGDASKWHPIPCPEPSWQSKYSLRVAYQQVTSELEPDSSYILRGSLRLPFPALLVASLLADHSLFIREALDALEGQEHLSRRAAERLKQFAQGQLVSQLQGASTAEPLRLGFAYEACSEVLECSVAAPSSPHTALRLWLLKSVRIIPVRSNLMRPRWDSGSTGSASAEGNSSLAGAPAAPEPGPSAEGATAGHEANGGAVLEASEPRPEALRPPTLLDEGSEEAPPSYLLIGAAVPPVDSSQQEAQARDGSKDSAPSRSSPGADGSSQGQLAAGTTSPAPATLESARASLPGSPEGKHRPPVAGTKPPAVPGLALGGSHSSGGTSSAPSPKSRGAASRLVHLKPSGVLVRPVSDSGGGTATEVNLCAILGKDSVRLFSGDLLGERLLFWQTLENLLFTLEQLCPRLPASFKPPLLAQQEQAMQAAAAGSVDDWFCTPPSSPTGGSSTAGELSQEKPPGEELEVQLVEVGTDEGGQKFVLDF